MRSADVSRHEADVAIAGRRAGGVFVIQANGSAVGLIQAGDDPQQGSLTGAGRSQQGDQFPAFDAEADVVEGFEGAEVFADVVDFDAHRDS